jgi:hypothetical protein
LARRHRTMSRNTLSRYLWSPPEYICLPPRWEGKKYGLHSSGKYDRVSLYLITWHWRWLTASPHGAHETERQSKASYKHLNGLVNEFLCYISILAPSLVSGCLFSGISCPLRMFLPQIWGHTLRLESSLSVQGHPIHLESSCSGSGSSYPCEVLLLRFRVILSI